MTRRQLLNNVYYSSSAKETEKIGSKLQKKFKNGGIFCLFGELGSGKTTFVKGFATSLGIDSKAVKSPTYTIERTYKTEKGDLHHFDFYRLEYLDELITAELEDLFKKKFCWILIEWPDVIENLLPRNTINIYLKHKNETEREVKITSNE